MALGFEFETSRSRRVDTKHGPRVKIARRECCNISVSHSCAGSELDDKGSIRAENFYLAALTVVGHFKQCFASLVYHSEWRADCVTHADTTGGAADRSSRTRRSLRAWRSLFAVFAWVLAAPVISCSDDTPGPPPASVLNSPRKILRNPVAHLGYHPASCPLSHQSSRPPIITEGSAGAH